MCGLRISRQETRLLYVRQLTTLAGLGELIFHFQVDYKLEQLRQFVQLFPAAPLTRPIIGFFRCTELPLEEDTDDNEDEPSEPIDYDAEFQIILVRDMRHEPSV